MTAPNGIPTDVWEKAEAVIQETIVHLQSMNLFYGFPTIRSKYEHKIIIAHALMAAEAKGREDAAKIADRHDGVPCKNDDGWTVEQCAFYDAGQLDASASIAAAIRNTNHSASS